MAKPLLRPRSQSKVQTRENAVFKPALKGRKIPILTLDNKWHQLFKQKGKSKRVEKLAEELNQLLKRQGTVNGKIKEVKALKRRLMDSILSASDELNSGRRVSLNEKKLSESKRLIAECNQQITDYEDEQLDLPRLIEGKNYDLMLATMESCYETMKENSREIERIDKWVNETRTELKKNLVLKQEMEETNQNLYAYMHDIFGSDVIDLFDMKYIPEKGDEDEVSGDGKGDETG